ncbi:hypothetical protein EYF80_047609 [Liparis tanakae]|uniref:Uncharacterized protein n=1 Tax=Liparis tanakae TaxID=230148 RepID=A0A4Z2FN64_9TELE|nr:hypothetical protein EYF80_047609 [Liparis tanakae]
MSLGLQCYDSINHFLLGSAASVLRGWEVSFLFRGQLPGQRSASWSEVSFLLRGQLPIHVSFLLRGQLPVHVSFLLRGQLPAQRSASWSEVSFLLRGQLPAQRSAHNPHPKKKEEKSGAIAPLLCPSKVSLRGFIDEEEEEVEEEEEEKGSRESRKA